MIHKTIEVSEDVYKKLLELKNANESISNLILRLINEDKKSDSIEEFAGVFKEQSDEWEKIERILYEERLREKNMRDIEL